jgi:guanylate kinase
MSNLKHVGHLFIVSAPSGAGKTSLVSAWIKGSPRIEVSVSYTTRAQRAGEIDGENYHFVDEIVFEAMIKEGAFLEYAKVFGCYYGTCKQGIFDRLAQDHDVVLEIDWQGAQQVKQQYPDAIALFILPPSLEALRDRLNLRGRDDIKEIELRLAQSKEEMSHYESADYVVINDRFEDALQQIMNLQSSMQLKMNNQRYKYGELLNNLLD